VLLAHLLGGAQRSLRLLQAHFTFNALDLRLRLYVEALGRVLERLVILVVLLSGLADCDSVLRLAHEVALAFVAELLQHELLLLQELPRLVLQRDRATRASTSVEDGVRGLELTAVLLDTTPCVLLVTRHR